MNYIAEWDKILADPEFQNQPLQVRQKVANNFYNEHFLTDTSFAGQSPETKEKVIPTARVPSKEQGVYPTSPMLLRKLGISPETNQQVMLSSVNALREAEAKGKPRIYNKDGTVSTERTITIEMDNKYFNIPTIINGQPFSNDDAIRMFREGKNNPVGVFGNEETAIQKAQERSKKIGDLIKAEPPEFSEEEAYPQDLTSKITRRFTNQPPILNQSALPLVTDTKTEAGLKWGLRNIYRPVERGLDTATGGFPLWLVGADIPPPETPFEAGVSVLTRLYGFLKGIPFGGASLLTKGLKPTQKGVREVLETMGHSGATLGIASGISEAIPAFREEEDTKSALKRIHESTAIGGIIGLLYPATGVIPTKPLRVGIGMAIMDLIRGKGDFTVDDVYRGIKDGSIDPVELTDRGMGFLTDIYFLMKTPSMRKQWDSLKAQFPDLSEKEVETTLKQIEYKPKQSESFVKGVPAEYPEVDKQESLLQPVRGEEIEALQKETAKRKADLGLTEIKENEQINAITRAKLGDLLRDGKIDEAVTHTKEGIKSGIPIEIMKDAVRKQGMVEASKADTLKERLNLQANIDRVVSSMKPLPEPSGKPTELPIKTKLPIEGETFDQALKSMGITVLGEGETLKHPYDPFASKGLPRKAGGRKEYQPLSKFNEGDIVEFEAGKKKAVITSVIKDPFGEVVSVSVKDIEGKTKVIKGKEVTFPSKPYEIDITSEARFIEKDIRVEKPKTSLREQNLKKEAEQRELVRIAQEKKRALKEAPKKTVTPLPKARKATKEAEGRETIKDETERQGLLGEEGAIDLEKFNVGKGFNKFLDAIDRHFEGKEQAEQKTLMEEFNKGGFKPAEKKTYRKDIVRWADEVGGIISERLGQIAPELKPKIKHHAAIESITTVDDLKKVEKIVKRGSKQSEGLQLVISELLFNRKWLEVEKYLSKEDMTTLRTLLDNVHAEAIADGIKVPYLRDHFPRHINNYKELMKLQGKEVAGRIDDAIRAMEAKLGSSLNNAERGAIADKIIRGHRQAGVWLEDPKYAKERKIETLTLEEVKCYSPYWKSLEFYIITMRKAIARNKFFGKGNYPTTAGGKTDKTLFGEDYESSLLDLQAKLGMQQSIGSLINQLKLKGRKIDYEQEKTIQSILTAYFYPRPESKTVTAIKGAIYSATIFNPFSALTQLKDQGITAALYGVENSLPSALKAVARRSTFKLTDIGMDNAKADFERLGLSKFFTSYMYKISLFTAMDVLGKENNVNAAMMAIRKQAIRNDPKLQEKLELIFGENADLVKQELIEGRKSFNVRVLAHIELSTSHPISGAEVPQRLLEGRGLTKLMYTLRTYQLKQISIFRDKAYNQIKSGHIKEGSKNLVKLSFALLIAGVAVDELRNFLTGKDKSLTDVAIDNLLQMALVNRYNYETLKREGPGSALWKQAQPAILGIADSVYKDSNIVRGTDKQKQNLKETGFRSTRYIPVFGKLYYEYFGRGKALEEEKKAKKLKDKDKKTSRFDKKPSRFK